MVGQFGELFDALADFRLDEHVHAFKFHTHMAEDIHHHGENPHCGKTGVPFMNSTTSFWAMSDWIRSKAGLDMEFLVKWPGRSLL